MGTPLSTANYNYRVAQKK